jgi:hypothetical protein
MAEVGVAGPGGRGSGSRGIGGIGGDAAGTGGFAVQPEALHRHAATLRAHREWAARLSAVACAAQLDPAMWGPVGAAFGLPERYRELSGAIGRHLAESVRFLGSAAARMAAGAAAYAAAEAAVAGALAAGALAGCGPAPGAAGRPGRQLFDPHDLHAAFPVAGLIENGAGAVRSGALGSALANCLDLGVAAWSVATDPLGFLCSAGLGYLVSVVQPLEDLLGQVTGNGDRIGRDAQAWQAVADGLAGLAVSLESAVGRDLAGWTGEAAAAARARLLDFTGRVRGLSGDVAMLVALMNAARAGMDAARALILEIISALAEWLVVTWLAAQATSVVTFGASEAAAMTATLAETDGATARAAAVLHRVEIAFGQVEGAFAGLARRVLAAVPDRLAGGAVADAQDVAASAAAGAAGRAAYRVATRAAAEGLVPAMHRALAGAAEEVGAAARRHAVRAGLRDGLVGGAAGAGSCVLGGALDRIGA